MRKEFIRLRFVIHNFYSKFQRCYLGTKSTIDADCGLARGNPQWLGVLDLLSKS